MPIVVLAEERICGQQACLPRTNHLRQNQASESCLRGAQPLGTTTPTELASRQACREYEAASSATRASHGSRLVPTGRECAGYFCSSEYLRVGGCGLDLHTLPGPRQCK